MIISSKAAQTYFNVVVGCSDLFQWTDKQTWMNRQQKKIGLFILAITFYLNYKMNQIYIMYMYLINVNFISATVINSLTGR